MLDNVTGNDVQKLDEPTFAEGEVVELVVNELGIVNGTTATGGPKVQAVIQAQILSGPNEGRNFKIWMNKAFDYGWKNLLGTLLDVNALEDGTAKVADAVGKKISGTVAKPFVTNSGKEFTNWKDFKLLPAGHSAHGAEVATKVVVNKDQEIPF